MTSTPVRVLAGGVLCAALAAAAGFAGPGPKDFTPPRTGHTARPVVAAGPTVPRCPEDEYLVGQGSFSGGLWASYACGPAHDDGWNAGTAAACRRARRTYKFETWDTRHDRLAAEEIVSEVCYP